MSKELVLTIITNDDNSKLLPVIKDQAIGAIHDSDFTFFGKDVLSEGIAIDIFFRGDAAGNIILKQAHEVFTAIFKDQPFDWFIQRECGRKKKMLIADMDSTMITIECIDELADFAGIKDKVSKITESAMRGELDFEASLRQRVGLLAGMSTDVLQECFDTRVKFTKGAKRLVKTMQRGGHETALVSGGFTFFTDKVSSELGFNSNKANQLEEKDGKLTGSVLAPISDAQTKLFTLYELTCQNRLMIDDVIAVGDGANDIPMIAAAGIGAAYRAKAKAQDAANFTINHSDLTSLLYIQGYTDDQIIKD